MRSTDRGTDRRDHGGSVTNRRRIRPKSLPILAIGAGAAVVLLIANIALTFRNTQRLNQDSRWVAHTHEVIANLENVLSLAKDAETGQRGFIIIGEPRYLKPYNAAVGNINQEITELGRLTQDNPRQQARFPELRKVIAAKLGQLDQTIALRQNSGFDAAQQRGLSDLGEQEMDALRAVVGEMIQEEQALLQVRSQQSDQTYRTATLTGLLSSLSGLAAVGALILLLQRYLNARSQATAIIAEQAERLRITLASIGDAVITTDTAGLITNMNAVAESLTGWSNDEAMGQPLDTVFRVVNEVTRQSIGNPAIRALAEGVVVGLANHTILIAQDGTERSIDDSAAPIRSEAGKIIGCVLVFRDVTEQRRQEERLRDQREQLDLALVAADLGQWNLRLSDQTAHRTLRHDQIFGYDSLRPEWTYEMFLEHVLPEDRPAVDAAFQAAIAAGSGWDCECRIRRADGAERWIWAKGRVQRDAQGASRMLGIVGDMTHQKQAEQAMREARSRLESTLAAGNVGTWEFDVVNNRVRADDNLARLFGVTPEAAAGEAIEAYIKAIHPDDRDRVLAAIGQAIEQGEHYEAEYRLIAEPGGSVRWVVARGRVERDETGRAVQLPGVVVDITDKRQVEEQLRESEARFRQIANTMPQIVWVARPDGYHEYYNRRWYEYIGCTPEECLGNGWNAPLHPDDQQRAIDRWNHSLCTGEDYEIEYRFRSKAGEYRWFLGRALPVRDDAGQIIKWFGTCTDIEDFKRLEEDRQMFVRLVENSTDFIGMCDLEGVPFYLNRAGVALMGLDKMEAACQVHLRDYFFPEDQSKIEDEFLPSVLEQGYGGIETRFRNFKTGEARWMVYSVTTLTDQSGQVVGFATISQDVTERRRLENDLRTLAADLSEADRRKDEFLAMLAHELRNPLAPIRNGLQIVRLRQADPQTVQTTSEMMERQVRHMVRLVDDLLDMSRISRGKIELRCDRVELVPIIEQAVEISRPAIAAAQHELAVTLPPQPVYLDADPDRLTQVFGNLLNNASKYTEPGGQITLSAELQRSEVVVSVQDTGVGIAADILPSIFEMFTQVERSLDRSQGGLGIGLTLVQQLVEMHGGTVDAFSEGPGQGSKFIVRLPVLNGQPQPAPPPTASPPTLAETRRVLVVDDNEDSALSLTMLFEIIGDETHTAHDGRAAVKAAATFRPDVVLLDIGLPQLNGYEVARQIRDQPWGQDMVLVALTGWGQEEDRHKSSQAGFNAHMVKPVDHDELLSLLTELTA